MNDRYLCKGKTIDNKEWVVGYYVEAEKLNSTGVEYLIIEKSADGSSHRVIPETVGQCTGLRYKDDKLMFEGDIARDEQSGYYYFIKWFPEYAGFALADRNGEITFGVEELEMFLDDLVVVGNIYDNSIEELRAEE